MMFKRTFAVAAAAASIAIAGPAAAQQQTGLVNVNLGDIEVDVEEVLSRNNVNVNLNAIVQIPVGLAANICPNVTVAALLAIAESDPASVCTADAASTSEGELNAVANTLQRQQRQQ